MSSAHIDQQTTEYLDGTLSPSLIQKVKSHIIFCNACRQYLTQIESNITHLKTLSKCTPSKNLKAEIVAGLINPNEGKNTLNSDSAPTDRSRTTTGPAFPLKTVATFAALVIVLGTVLARRYNRIPAPSTPLTANVTPPLQSEEKPGNPEQEKTNAPLPSKSVSLLEKPVTKPVPAKNVDVVEKQHPVVTPLPVVAAAPAPVKAAPLTVLSGGSSGISDERALAISNDNAWKELWMAHVKNLQPAPPRPEVDFNENDVIVIFAGNQPSAGYSIKIKKIQDTSWEGRPARVVYYWLQKPAPGTITASMISQPFYMKTVKRLSGKTYFKKLTQ